MHKKSGDGDRGEEKLTLFIYLKTMKRAVKIFTFLLSGSKRPTVNSSGSKRFIF